jgi:hypothetical protein
MGGKKIARMARKTSTPHMALAGGTILGWKPEVQDRRGHAKSVRREPGRKPRQYRLEAVLAIDSIIQRQEIITANMAT